MKTPATAPYSAQLGTDVPRGAPSSWGPICTPVDCDAFVTIVTPLFALAHGTSLSTVRLDALRNVLSRLGLTDRALVCAAGAPVGGLWFATDPVEVEHGSGAVCVRGIAVCEPKGRVDVAAIAAADLKAGASASAWLLVDSERAHVPLLGTVLMNDCAVVRAQVDVVAEAAFARLRVDVVDDRCVYRAAFAMPWIATSTVITLGAANGIGVEVGATAQGLLPWPARWAVFFGARPG